MNAKDLLAKIKGLFDAPPVVTPAAPAEPNTEGEIYTLQDGRQISIIQAGDVPAVGDMVSIDGAPAPAGDLILQDGTIITVDATGAITAYTPMVTDPAQPDTSMEARVKALEEQLAKLTNPVTASQFSAQEDEVKGLKEQVAKQDGIIKLMLELCEQLTGLPTADPATLTGKKKEKFDANEAREKHFQSIADGFKAAKTQKKY